MQRDEARRLWILGDGTTITDQEVSESRVRSDIYREWWDRQRAQMEKERLAMSPGKLRDVEPEESDMEVDCVYDQPKTAHEQINDLIRSGEYGEREIDMMIAELEKEKAKRQRIAKRASAP